MLVNSAPKSPAPLQRFGSVFCAWLMAALLCGFGHTAVAQNNSEKVDFSFEVRPILADRCFKCHGPDEKTRKAKLRLDLPESAYAVRDPKKQTRAIVPGHPEQSEL